MVCVRTLMWSVHVPKLVHSVGLHHLFYLAASCTSPRDEVYLTRDEVYLVRDEVYLARE